jgi:N-acetylneuraminic acid mutarotase
MRRWYLITLLLLCLLLPPSVMACSGARGPQNTGEGTGAIDGSSTTNATIKRTTTTLAPATWEALTPSGTLPEARLGGSLVYAPSGNTLLLFGGWAGGTKYSADTWSYDLTASAWTKLKPTGTSPSPRASQAMAFDPVANRLIVFGGYDGAKYLSDIWAYDLTGNVWTGLNPAGVAPAARHGHSLVYDPESKKMILFGGYDGSVQYNDTWAYDPASNTWADLKPGGDLPAARDSQAMAYDSDAKAMVLFGGWSATRQFDDTWAYDPAKNSWTDLKPAGEAPTARALQQMVYDPAIKKLVLFGGGTSSATFNDAWLFDLTDRSWTPVTAAGTAPPARAGQAMVYDSSTKDILLFGGSNGIGTYFNDLWRLRR